MDLIRDKHGRLTGVVRKIAGGARLYTPQGEAVADYSPATELTYDTQRRRIGSGNRLAGLVDDEE
jgi:hypothetical protein